ncbi:MAG: alpha/beta hydrolase, partial [Alkalinema sp. RL_2_19]|nr:alpha/beta hydrolase [Alkalinema sp. RL_2_19]
DIRGIGPTDQPRFRSYLVSSTAPVNVEQPPLACEGGDPQQAIVAMAQFITQHAEGVEILIQIHGYNTDAKYIAERYEETAQELARTYGQAGGQAGGQSGGQSGDQSEVEADNSAAQLFLCYRWSSEPVATALQDSIALAQSALPQLLRLISQSSKFGILTALIGLVFGVLLVISEGIRFALLLVVFLVVLLLAIVLIVPIFTLLVLRVSNYFRDVHRADQYGVLDLIEFIRQLNRAVMQQSDGQWTKPRIRLSFIGYSMGAFVVTQAVRILSDVFDRQSISTLDMSDRAAPPPAEVGDVFRLGRLVLVAPDISTESIISGRGNTLRSSIRRFEEAYLFCNEGDMALRVASTVANYFSFPAGTREGGYRLGAMTVRQPENKSEKVMQYGILNLSPQGELADRRNFLDYLSIRRDFSLRKRQEAMWGHDESRHQAQSTTLIQKLERKPIAELFTYFDCTDYQEVIADPQTGVRKPQGILGLATGKASLGYLDLIKLAIALAQGKLDPHGGYLQDRAKFSRQLIFGLGYLGFGGLLDRLVDAPDYADCYAQVCEQQPNLQPQQQQRLAAVQVFSRYSNQRSRHPSITLTRALQRRCASRADESARLLGWTN